MLYIKNLHPTFPGLSKPKPTIMYTFLPNVEHAVKVVVSQKSIDFAYAQYKKENSFLYHDKIPVDRYCPTVIVKINHLPESLNRGCHSKICAGNNGKIVDMAPKDLYVTPKAAITARKQRLHNMSLDAFTENDIRFIVKNFMDISILSPDNRIRITAWLNK